MQSDYIRHPVVTPPSSQSTLPGERSWSQVGYGTIRYLAINHPLPELAELKRDSTISSDLLVLWNILVRYTLELDAALNAA